LLCRSAQIDICVGTLFNELPGDFDPTNGEHRCQHIREGIGAAYSWWGVDSSGVESHQLTLRNFQRRDGGVFTKILARSAHFEKSATVGTSHNVFEMSLRSCFPSKR